MKNLQDEFGRLQEKVKKLGEWSLTPEEKYFLELLDKVFHQGRDSLTEEENAFLTNLREEGEEEKKIPQQPTPKTTPKEESLLSFLPWAIGPILLILLLALVCLPKLSEWRHYSNLPAGYKRLDTAHFRVYYPQKHKKEISAIAQKAEDFIKELSQSYQGQLGDLSPPSYRVSLSFFLNHQDFSHYAWKATSRAFANNGGYFDPLTGEIALIISEAPDLGQSGIRHEMAHYLFSRGGGNVGSGLAPYLSEGLAVFFEMADPKDPFGQVDLSPRESKFASASKEPMALPEIVGLSQRDFTKSGNGRVYSFSYLLVYFLWSRDGAKFWQYVRRARWGKDKDYQAFLTYFGPEEELLEDWQKFLLFIRNSFLKKGKKK